MSGHLLYGLPTGFIGGMAQDFLLNQPKGITALTLTLLGYAIGMLRQYIVSPSPFLPVRRLPMPAKHAPLARNATTISSCSISGCPTPTASRC